MMAISIARRYHHGYHYYSYYYLELEASEVAANESVQIDRK